LTYGLERSSHGNSQSWPEETRINDRKTDSLLRHEAPESRSQKETEEEFRPEAPSREAPSFDAHAAPAQSIATP